MKLRWVTAVLFASASLWLSCSTTDSEPRNLVLITIDTWRHDAIGYSETSRASTPNLDRLTAESRAFSFAHAHSVVTLPSHASILTGQYPFEHGVRDNAGYRLGEDKPTIAAFLGDAGFETAAFVSAFPLDRRFGLAQNFDHYDDEYEGYAKSEFTPPERPGDRTVAAALEWWNARGDQPRFMWVHLFTPHYPYEAGSYFDEVAVADRELAPLLDVLLKDRSTAIVLTSDHGEGLGDHGEATHGMFAYESTLRVPLVIRFPGKLKPGIDPRSARHIDLLPTMLDGFDLDVPPQLRGRSLLADGGGEVESYFEALSPWLNRGWAPLTGVISTEREKAIRLPIAEFYELEDDPKELQNLAPVRPQEWASLLERYPLPTSGKRSEALDAETIARLESLGYAASNAEISTDFGPEDDPKNLLIVDEQLAEALASYRDGEVDTAIAQMRALIESQPKLSLAYAHLAYFFSDLGRVDEAIDTLRIALARGAANESIRRKLALALTRVGKSDDAWAVLSVDTDSEDPETQSALGRVLARQGKPEQAMARFERALSIDPSFPTALMDSGILLLEHGQFGEAEPRLREAVERDAFLAEAWNGLGVIESGRDPQAAVAAWRQAVQADPRLSDAWFNLGIMLERIGKPSEARDAFERCLPLVGPEARRDVQQRLDQLRRAG